MDNIDSSITLKITEPHPEFIETHPDKSWNWEWLSQNPVITSKFIESPIFQDKPWIWDPETPDQE